MRPDWAVVRERTRLADTVVVTVTTLAAVACIIPLYQDLSWLAPAIAMVLLVACLGALGRAIALPIPFIPLLQLIGIGLAATVLYARGEAWGGWFPTEEAWGVLRDLARVGLLDAEAFAAPVPMLPGVMMLGVLSAGLIALALDTLIVSVRTPLLGGLVVLALYAGCAALQFGRAPWWTFPVAAAGWLLALAADQRDRLREWADLPTTHPVRGLARAARRIGIAAIAVALLLGVVLPVRDTSALPSSGGGGDGAGGSQASGREVLLDPLVSMRRNLTLANDTEVLTYRTTADRPTYLRVTALESFDGSSWRQRPGLESGRDPGWPLPGLVAGPEDGDVAEYDIAVASLANSFLPLPYPVAAIEDVAGLGDAWSIDASTGVAFSDGASATGLRYAVTALEPDVSPRDLRSAPKPEGTLWPQLNLPGGIPAIVGRTAEEVTAGAATDYDRAVALQDWFTSGGGFSYSTSVRSGSSGEYLAEFLVDRVGYCEQFAGAMAVMARHLGIPARVVVGFTQGSRGADGTWTVTVRDAHAWPELWFEGVGWVRFEPTPRGGATVQAPAYAPSGLVDAQSRGVLEPEGFPAVDLPEAREPGPGAVPTSALVLGAAVLLGLAALAVPALRRRWHRHRWLRGPGYDAVVEGAWAEVGATAIDLGQPWSALATPRQAADRLARGMPAAGADAVRRLRAEVERVRYGPAPAQGWGEMPERAAAVRADVRTVARSLRERVRRSRRAAAYCWPSSERRRQRSSMRSMNPDDFAGRGAAGAAVPSVSASGARVRNAE